MSARQVDRFATVAIRGIAGFLVLLLLGIVGYLVVRGLPELNLHFLTTPPREFEPGGGIAPQLFNSFYIVALSMVFTIPLGLAAGIYLAEYARPGLPLTVVRVTTETLATLPSIVVGLFGLLLFVEITGWHFTRLGGALALTVVNLPYAVRITEDAIRNVPDQLREASLALAATRWQTISRVVLPASLASFVTGIILITGRAFGEAAALLYTAGLSTPTRHFLTLNPFVAGETLSVHLYAFRTESTVPDVNQIADGTAALLVIIVLLFNVAARILGRAAVRRVSAT